MTLMRIAEFSRAHPIPVSAKLMVGGYLFSAALIGLLFLTVRFGSADAEPYNYGLLAMCAFVAAAVGSTFLFAFAIGSALDALRQRRNDAMKWQRLILLLSVAPIFFGCYVAARLFLI
jgi:hypothetical protein